MYIASFSGTQRHVRRRVLPSSSPIAKGITWQWEGDTPGAWIDFDVDVAEYIEDCFHKRLMLIDLSTSPFRLPYHLDILQMIQKRIHTGRVRKIQRTFTKVSYPSDTSGQQSGVKRQLGGPSTRVSSKRTRLPAIPNSTSVPVQLLAPMSNISPSFNQNIRQGGTNTIFNPFTVTGPPSTNTVPITTVSMATSMYQSQGPLTRRRYQQSQTGHAVSMTTGPSRTTVVSTGLSNLFLPSNNPQSLQGSTTVPSVQYSGGPMPNFQSAMFQHTLPNGLVGGNMYSAPPSFNFQAIPSTSGGHIQPG